jgi:O6-methylguanine-DNA--protein-cysteine methyltransferase
MQRPGAPPSAARQWQALSEQPGGELRACPQVAAVSTTPARAVGAAAATTDAIVIVIADADADADADAASK